MISIFHFFSFNDSTNCRDHSLQLQVVWDLYSAAAIGLSLGGSASASLPRGWSIPPVPSTVSRMKRWERLSWSAGMIRSLFAPGLQTCATKGCQVQWLRDAQGAEDIGRYWMILKGQAVNSAIHLPNKWDKTWNFYQPLARQRSSIVSFPALRPLRTQELAGICHLVSRPGWFWHRIRVPCGAIRQHGNIDQPWSTYVSLGVCTCLFLIE